MVRGTYIYEKSYNQDHIVLDVFLHLAGTLCGGTARQTNTHAVLNLMAAHCTIAHAELTEQSAHCPVQSTAECTLCSTVPCSTLPGLCTLPCSTLPSSFDQKSGVISAAATAHSFTGLTSSCIKSGFLFSLFRIFVF